MPVTKPQIASSAPLCSAPAFQNRTGAGGMRLKRQPRLSRQALSNSADATSTVSFRQAIASSNGFVGANDPTNPPTTIHRRAVRGKLCIAEPQLIEREAGLRLARIDRRRLINFRDRTSHEQALATQLGEAQIRPPQRIQTTRQEQPRITAQSG